MNEYKQWDNLVYTALTQVERLLYKLKIFSASDLPYVTQLISLAVIFVKLGRDETRKIGTQNKIARWYWCGVFSEQYGKIFEAALLGDLDVKDWLLGKNQSEPFTIKNAEFVASRLVKLNSRNSASYKGLCALLMEDGCRDFFTDTPIDEQKYFDDEIDMHHIFPQDWCKRKGIDPKDYNSIINKTPLSASTNGKIGRRPPSEYLKIIVEDSNISVAQMDEILRSHSIEPEHLWKDDFEAFFCTREKALLSKIETAMGKPPIVSKSAELETDDAVAEEEEEDTASQLGLDL